MLPFSLYYLQLALSAALVFCLFSPGEADAQSSTTSGNFQVLQTRKVYEGNRWIIMNRVAPPLTSAASTAAATPSQAVSTQGSAGSTTTSPASPATGLIPFAVTATVYNGQISELRWSDETGAHHGYANFDFHYAAFLGSVQGTSGQYLLVFNATNGASTDPGAQSLPALASFPAWSAVLLAPDNPAAPGVAAADALPALAEYFDANKSGIIAGYNSKVAAQQWAASHPAAPQNITINFWPIKSNVYSTAPGSSTTAAELK